MQKLPKEFLFDVAIDLYFSQRLERLERLERFERVLDFGLSTTMIYTHVLNRGGKGVRSPADGL